MTDQPARYSGISVATDEYDAPFGQIRFDELIERIQYEGTNATEQFRIKTTHGDIDVTAEGGEVVLRVVGE